MNRAMPPESEAAVQKLVNHPARKRLLGFSASCVETWAPNMQAYMVSGLRVILQHYPGLKPNTGDAPDGGPRDPPFWAAQTRNKSGTAAKQAVVTVPHRDHENLAFGWCQITAFGNYNARRGGQLILWDLGIVIDFPAGTCC